VPEYLRSLVVIASLAALVFALAMPLMSDVTTAATDYRRRRNLWFAITLAAFLAHNYWVFVAATATLLGLTLAKEHNKPALFFLVLFAVPAYPVEISGFGLVRYFFTLDYIRLLTLAILLPAFLSLVGRTDLGRFGRTIPDKLVAAYLILQFVLLFRSPLSFTDQLRYGVFYAFIDAFLPYYVASRSLRNVGEFRDALAAFVLAGLVLAATASFEYAKHWLLFHPLESVLGADWGYGNYLLRGTSLRALATTGQPVALGYVMAVALGFAMYLRESSTRRSAWLLGMAVLAAGLIAAVSRGPWVGAAVILLVFIALGRSPLVGIFKLGLVGVAAAPVLLLTSAGSKIVDLLPFVGTVEESTVTYRELFTKISIQFIEDHPLFGAYDFANSPMMKILKPQGLLDTLNTFLAVGLGSGLVGMSLFAGIFLTVALGLFQGARMHANKKDELYSLGRALFATLVGMIVILCTTSSITVIPVIYWSVLGLGVAYAHMALSAPTVRSERSSFAAGQKPASSYDYRN
jgi:O-antigen ligase